MDFQRTGPMTLALAALLWATSTTTSLAQDHDAPQVNPHLETRGFSLVRRHSAVPIEAGRSTQTDMGHPPDHRDASLQAHDAQLKATNGVPQCAPPDSFYLDGYEPDQP